MLTSIDPGTPPTLAHVGESGTVSFIPVVGVHRLAWAIEAMRSPVVTERVTIFPGESLKHGVEFVGSMFATFGVCAALELVCYAIPPAVWKRQSGVPGKKEKGARKAICGLAAARWPAAKALIGSDHNRGDALLLAAWALDRMDQLERWRVT